MKVLVAGLGGIGQRHIRNLRSTLGADVEIIGYDLRRDIPVLTDQLQLESGSNLEQKYNLQIFLDLDLALAQKPDMVFVCNPTSLHVKLALKAAQEGCHLFVEKPLSHNLEQVEQLVALAESRGLKTNVGYQMRFHPCLQRLHALLQENMIGRILAVRAEIGEYLPGWHTYEDYRQMYASRQDLGGGVILSQIHEMDYLYWLFGLPRSVYALGGHLSLLEVDVEDTADILMNFTPGDQSVPVSLHVDYLQRPPCRKCDVIGDRGKILINLVTPSVEVFDGEGKQVEINNYAGFQRNQMFVDELKHFFASLRGSPDYISGQGAQGSLVTIREAVNSLRMALAAKESLATGNVIEIKRKMA